MKRIVVAALAACALTSFGAWEKVGTVRLADVDSLVKGVARLGEHTGNQMLGIMSSQYIGKLPAVQFFGPGRPGAATSYELYVDGKKLSGDLDEAFESVECAIVYPIAKTKAEFLAAHPKAVETNGLVRVCLSDSACEEEPDDEADDDNGSCATEIRYVAFSPDGRWATYSDKPEQAMAALKDVKAAERKMDGDQAKLIVTKKGWDVFARAIELAAKDENVSEEDRKQLALFKPILGQLRNSEIGLRIDERGLDFRGNAKVVEGSDLSKIGLKTIADDAWKTAGANALIVSDRAEDSGARSVPWKAVLTVLAKHGIETSFLAYAEPAPNYAAFTLDVPAAVEYFKGFSNAVNKVDCKALTKDIVGLMQPNEQFLPLKSPAIGLSYAIKGYTPTVDAKTRFEKTLPEAKGKPVYVRGVFSFYAVLKSVVPVILANVEPTQRTVLEPLLTTLPPEGKTGVAFAGWREKNAHRFIVRVGADEFKGISAGMSVVSSLAMQEAMKKTNERMQKAQEELPEVK